MPNAFLTGGTGFVGLNLAALLAERGWSTVAVHRAGSTVDALRPLVSELRVADVRDARALHDAMPEDVDAVFHVAASISYWRAGNAEQTAINVGGTRNVVDAAVARGAGRLVHTSTIDAYGYPPAGTVLDESYTGTAEGHWVNYARTKWLAEQEVERGIAAGLDAVFLNPSNILGPHDRGGWSRTFRLVKEGKLPGVPAGGGSFCHVVEVARAHLAACERGRCGERYILGGADASYAELAALAAELCGVPAPRRIPGWMMLALGRVNGWVSAVTRREPDVTPEIALLLTHDVPVDCSKAQRELGFQPVPLRTMVEDTFAWMQKEGMI